MKRYLPPLLAALLVAALALALLRGGGEANGKILVGQPAPNFTLRDLDGHELSLAGLKGRPVVLNFWASWCAPCRAEAPLLRDLAARQRAGGLALVGVLYSDKPDPARAFRDEYGLAFPSLLDPNLKTAIDYGVTGVPETLFIGPDGKVAHRVIGELTRDSLDEGLSKLGLNATARLP